MMFARRARIVLLIDANAHVSPISKSSVEIAQVSKTPPVGDVHPEETNVNGQFFLDFPVDTGLTAINTHEQGETLEGCQRQHTRREHREIPHIIDYQCVDGCHLGDVTHWGHDSVLASILAETNARGAKVLDHTPTRSRISFPQWPSLNKRKERGPQPVRWDHNLIRKFSLNLPDNSDLMGELNSLFVDMAPPHLRCLRPIHQRSHGTYGS